MIADDTPAASIASFDLAHVTVEAGGGIESAPLVGSSARENVMTRHRFDRASTAGSIHSHRPWMPGTSTTGVPDPRSMIFMATGYGRTS